MRNMLIRVCLFGCLFVANPGTRAVSPAVLPAVSRVDAQANGTWSATHINKRLKAIFRLTSSTTKTVDLFKIRYFSHDEKGHVVVLSGLVAWPRGGAPKGLVLYNHGTTADRKMSPSLFRGASDNSETELAVLLFASNGFAVALPDYLGLGDNLGAHPFPLGKINARSAVDLIVPARALATQRKVVVGSRLFVTGYSEGGAVALWTLRVLESQANSAQANSAQTNLTSPVFAAAPLSGPYDLSGATRQSLVERAPNATAFAARLYLLAYSVYSFHKNRGVKLVDYFKPSMAATINDVFNKKLSDENIIKRLALTAFLMRSKNSLQNVVTPRFWNALQTRDTRDPLIRELQNNDCTNWSPRTKTLLVALQNDQIVVSANTRNALQTMRKRGVGTDILRANIVRDDKLNHITFIAPALLRARQFFNGGFASVDSIS